MSDPDDTMTINALVKERDAFKSQLAAMTKERDAVQQRAHERATKAEANLAALRSRPGRVTAEEALACAGAILDEHWKDPDGITRERIADIIAERLPPSAAATPTVEEIALVVWPSFGTTKGPVRDALLEAAERVLALFARPQASAPNRIIIPAQTPEGDTVEPAAQGHEEPRRTCWLVERIGQPPMYMRDFHKVGAGCRSWTTDANDAWHFGTRAQAETEANVARGVERVEIEAREHVFIGAKASAPRHEEFVERFKDELLEKWVLDNGHVDLLIGVAAELAWKHAQARVDVGLVEKAKLADEFADVLKELRDEDGDLYGWNDHNTGESVVGMVIGDAKEWLARYEDLSTPREANKADGGATSGGNTATSTNPATSPPSAPLRAIPGTSMVSTCCGCRWKRHADGTFQLYDAAQRPCAKCDNGPASLLRPEEPEDEELNECFRIAASVTPENEERDTPVRRVAALATRFEHEKENTAILRAELARVRAAPAGGLPGATIARSGDAPRSPAPQSPAPGRAPVTHELKCWRGPFQAVIEGLKSFEWRKADRDYRVGDTLLLREWDGDIYTVRNCIVEVTWILRAPHFGMPDGYVCMSIAKPGTTKSPAPHVSPENAEELREIEKANQLVGLRAALEIAERHAECTAHHDCAHSSEIGDEINQPIIELERK